MVSVAMETCSGMRPDLVDVLKNDQKRLGFEGRVSVKEAKNFSRLSFINFLDIRRKFLYFSRSFCIFLAVEFVRRILRCSVSFFLIRDNISPVNHSGLYLPLTVFLGTYCSAMSKKVSLHKFQSLLMSDAELGSAYLNYISLKVIFIASKSARL